MSQGGRSRFAYTPDAISIPQIREKSYYSFQIHSSLHPLSMIRRARLSMSVVWLDDMVILYRLFPDFCAHIQIFLFWQDSICFYEKCDL